MRYIQWQKGGMMNIKQKLNEWAHKNGKKKGIICTIVASWTRNNDFNNVDNQKVSGDTWFPYSIIHDGPLTMDQCQDKYKRVHSWGIYRLIKPGVWLVKKFMGKWLVEKIYDSPYNKNLVVFETAFEKTVGDWLLNYQYDKTQMSKDTLGIKKWFKKEFKDGTKEFFRLMKRIVETAIISDSAVREFFNVLMFNITIRMSEAYKDNEKLQHLFFTQRFFNDVDYFKIHGTLEDSIILPFDNGKYLFVRKEHAVILDKLPDGFEKKDIVDAPNKLYERNIKKSKINKKKIGGNKK